MPDPEDWADKPHSINASEWICDTCGGIIRALKPPAKCPHCGASKFSEPEE